MSLSFIKDCLQIFEYFKDEIVISKSNFSFNPTAIGLDNDTEFTQITIELNNEASTAFGIRYRKELDTLLIVRALDSNIDLNISIKLDDFISEDEPKLILIHGRYITNSGLFGDDLESCLNHFEEFKSSKLISPIFKRNKI